MFLFSSFGNGAAFFVLESRMFLPFLNLCPLP